MKFLMSKGDFMRNSDNIKVEEKEITCISEFIKIVKSFLDKKNMETMKFLYRGECVDYDRPCEPNIFRKDILSTNPLYEKSLFNAMGQNGLTESASYLENAIDAQHGEFPSRLLDVSYNCLNALYFAVTPYYRKSVSEFDKENGAVYIFYMKEIFSPSAQNTNDNYNAIINKNKKWFSDNNLLFAKNHKFIDHTKINKRIVAQQGAFILFQGDDVESIPAYMVDKIVIPAHSKKKLRTELSILFGINTGSIYPEIVNLVEDIEQKSSNLITEDFCIENELKYVLINFERELDFYGDMLCGLKNNEFGQINEIVRRTERLINSYRIGFDSFLKSNFQVEQEKAEIDIKEKVKNEYNNILENFVENMKKILNIEISDELFIRKEYGND